MKRTLTIFGLFILALGVAGGAYSQTDDVFAFIPDGGRTLLAKAMAAGVSEETKTELLTGKRTSAEWLAYIETQVSTVLPLAELDEYQRQTLADYLAYNMPLATMPEPVDATTMPRDGRDLSLEYCQSCHIITVVITQDRAREAWLGTLHKPSHIEVNLTEPEREALADYLVVNAGIPIEEVPPELRAGGASY
ncbi:MAG: hypothetical protein ACYCZU_09075 [Devosia sp.]